MKRATFLVLFAVVGTGTVREAAADHRGDQIARATRFGEPSFRPSSGGRSRHHHDCPPRGRFDAPKKYTLALGDSLAFGIQIAQLVDQLNTTGEIDPEAFIGHADYVFDKVKRLRPNARLVNLSCPGESTATFSSGGCPWTTVDGFPLKVDYTGSQESAALAFLQEHRGQVSPILLTIGFNDVYQLGDTPEAMAPRLKQLLRKLRHAAPDAEILINQYYDPFAFFDDSQTGTILAINDAIEAAADAADARVVDPYPAFNLALPQPDTLCALTNICGDFGDIHPTDAGYKKIAQLIWRASDYDRHP